MKIGNITKKLHLSTQGKTNEEDTFYSQHDHNQDFRRRMSLEINEFAESTFDMFSSRFWPQVRNHANCKDLKPELVWTQITSIIKGSTSSYKYERFALPKDVYV